MADINGASQPVFLNLWQELELGIFRKSLNLLSFLCSNFRLSINIEFHLFTFLVVNIAIYVQQLYSTTGTGLAKCLWPTLISWAWLLDLDEQISFFIMFHPLENNLHSFAHVICSVREPFLFCEVTFRAKTRVLFPDHKEKRGFRCVYCKGKVIFPMTDETNKCKI